MCNLKVTYETVLSVSPSKQRVIGDPCAAEIPEGISHDIADVYPPVPQVQPHILHS